MAIIQKISINKPLTSRDAFVVRDDTGPVTKTNEGGYGGINGNPIDSIYKYVFHVNDKVRGTVVERIFGEDVGNVLNPPVDRIAYREDVYIVPTSGKFPDSIYTVTMNTVMEYEYDGTGLKGQDFIINVPGHSALVNYNSIYSEDGKVYKITKVDTENRIVFLDRTIENDFTGFRPALSITSEVIVIYQQLEDCITSKILDFLDSEGDCDERPLNSINDLRMLYWGLQRSIESGDYNAAYKYMHRVQNICGFLNCGCHGR